MKIFQLENESLQFVDGIVMQNLAAAPTTVRVLACRSLIPAEWSDMEFGFAYAAGELRVDFSRPVNDPHFRLDLTGELPDAASFALRLHDGVPPGALDGILQSRRIIFLGCARNCAAHLDSSIATLAELGARFGDCRIGIFENDSTDATGEELARLAKRYPLTVLRESGVDEWLPLRTARIAYARNRLLAWARTQPEADYICFADLDGIVNRDLPPEGFLSNFSCEAAWDAVFPVSDDFCYDIYALRQKDLATRDYTKAVGAVDASLGRDLARWLEGHSKLLDLRRMPGWLPVASAFGGMGLYKYRALIDSRYVGLDADNREVCEHVGVNERIAGRGGRLYINPQFVLVPWADPEDWKGGVVGGYWNSRHWPRRRD